MSTCLVQILPSLSCFISHIGVFFGVFLGPILLILIYNVCIFITVLVVLVKHTLAHHKQMMFKKKLDLSPEEAYSAWLRFYHCLHQLEWTLAAMLPLPFSGSSFSSTFSKDSLFFFIVVLSADARSSWLTFMCPRYKSTPSTSKSYHTGDTSSTLKWNTFSSSEYSIVKS